MEPSPVHEVLDRIAQFVRYGEATEEEVQGWVEQLETHATASDLPAMLGVLEDDDESGVLWGVLYVAEGLDDDYLVALLDGLDGLWQRAPQWAITALLRIVNSRGEPDDCTPALIQLAHARPAARDRLTEILTEVERDAELPPDQATAVGEVRAALTAH